MPAICRTYGTFPRCEWSDHRRVQTLMEGVSKLADSGDSEAPKPCYRCGKTSHLPWKCPFSVSSVVKRDVRNVCRSGSVATGKGRNRQAVQQLEAEMAEVQADKYEEYELCQLQSVQLTWELRSSHLTTIGPGDDGGKEPFQLESTINGRHD